MCSKCSGLKARLQLLRFFFTFHLQGVNDRVSDLCNNRAWLCVLKLENAFNHRYFSCSGVHTTESNPIIDYKSSSNNIATSVDGTSDEWNLQQRRQFILIF